MAMVLYTLKARNWIKTAVVLSIQIAWDWTLLNFITSPDITSDEQQEIQISKYVASYLGLTKQGSP